MGGFGKDLGSVSRAWKRFWDSFGESLRFLQIFVDFGDFWSILGEFWEPMLEAFWRPRRMKIGKHAFFVTFFQVSKRDADLETIWGRFSWRAQKQK